MAREIYFLIQKISTATERNTNFEGEVHTHIVGKDDYALFRETSDTDVYGNFNFLTPYFVREHGYKRQCDAKRNWTYKHPDVDEPYWSSDVRIVRAWVRKDGKVCIEP